MFHAFLLIICAAFAASVPITQIDLPEFTCDEFGSHCVLHNVNLPADQPEFNIISSNPANVRSIDFRDSIISHFGTNLCELFPNLELLDLQRTGIETLGPNVFNGCTKLLSLALNDNKITQLSENQFESATKLRYLYLENNQIRQIANNQFVHNTDLYFLYLNQNYIQSFPASAVKGLSQLLGLTLTTNDLADIDERGLTANLPRLNYVEFNHNELACSRVQEIVKGFKDAKVRVFVTGEPRKRFYKTAEVDGVVCLFDKVWTSTFYRKQNHVNYNIAKVQLKDEVKALEHIVQSIKVSIQ